MRNLKGKEKKEKELAEEKVERNEKRERRKRVCSKVFSIFREGKGILRYSWFKLDEIKFYLIEGIFAQEDIFEFCLIKRALSMENF